MNKLLAGFSRLDITPPLGCRLQGYYKTRYAEGVLDPLEVNCLALRCDDATVALLSVDHCGLRKEILNPVRETIAETLSIPFTSIYIHSTHTHNGPYVEPETGDPLDETYHAVLCHKLVDAVRLALNDLKPARMGYGIGKAPHIAFIRRYRMKDGSVRTNPGVNNPDILEPIGEVDERIGVVRFDREGDSLVLVNFACHPDTVGGSHISADWPGFVRRSLEQAVPEAKCIFFNGAQGDVNHVNVWPKAGDLNDMFMDFDDVSRGYGHARHMGRVVVGGVLQVYDKLHYVDVDRIGGVQRTVRVPSNMPNAADLPEAQRINALHEAGRDHEIPFTGMMLTTVVAEAARILRLQNGPDSFEMPLSGISIGNIAFVGIPGEPFGGVGRELKAVPGWDLVIPTCNTNAKEGYFPMQDSYDQGGYEAKSSNFKAGVAELLIEEGKKLLHALKENIC